MPVRIGGQIVGSDTLTDPVNDMKIPDGPAMTSSLEGFTDARHVLNAFANSKRGAVDKRNLKMRDELDQFQSGKKQSSIDRNKQGTSTSPSKQSPFKVTPQKYNFKDKNSITGISPGKSGLKPSLPKETDVEREINKAIEKHEFCDQGTIPLDAFVERFRLRNRDPRDNEPNKQKL